MGKTSALKALLPLLEEGGTAPCVCKIDCLKTGDGALFQRMGLPCVTGLSGDICPDHFLVSNLPELWDWADRLKRDTLVIETAGLCHRCSPATQHMTAGCVLDCTASCRASGQLGPMLTQADFVVLTKIDMVSQAELEIISWQIRQINPGAALFRWTVWRAMEPTFWPGGCWTGLRAAALRGTFCGTPCPAGSAPTAWESSVWAAHSSRAWWARSTLRRRKYAVCDHSSRPDKTGKPEPFQGITLERGELCTIVGNTGSGKSRFIKDVEQLAHGDSVTRRRVLLDGVEIPAERRQSLSSQLVAHLGQNMRFVLDASVEEFLALHAQCRGKETPPVEVLALANEITPEPVALGQSLNQLSGGQSRALMIADIALLCDSPIVLIDEIENAGIDKERALGLLQRHDKLVLVVTHDPHTALMSRRRIVMGGGAVAAVVERSPQEAALYMELGELYRRQQTYQASLRRGDHLA